RHRGLDSLLPADDLDAITLLEEFVEGPLLEVPRRQAGDAAGPNVDRLDCHALTVREAKPPGDDDGLRWRDAQQTAEASARWRDAELEGSARGSHAPAPHVVGEGRHRELLRDLRLAHERSGAAAPDEVSLAC